MATRVPPDQPDLPREVHRFAHQAMATVFEIVCLHEDKRYAEQAALAAFDLIDRVELELTCHRESSDISRINHLKSEQNASVGLWTMHCLGLAQHFKRTTGGAFDISLGSGLDALELIPDESRVRVHANGIRLDLGGIGKGYAIDRVRELLEEWEVHNSLVHGGFSSVLALDGPRDGDGWPVTISNPASGSVLARVAVQRATFSASGIRKTDHIIDPRTGQPVRNRTAAWVLGPLKTLSEICDAANTEAPDSPSAAAEALSTAFMIISLEEIDEWCREHPGLQAWIQISDASACRLCHFPVG